MKPLRKASVFSKCECQAVKVYDWMEDYDDNDDDLGWLRTLLSEK